MAIYTVVSDYFEHHIFITIIPNFGADAWAPTKMSNPLPYFDVLLDNLDKGFTDLDLAFGRHVHWGYWPNPDLADGTASDFARAAEALSETVWRAGDIREGQKILDVGCGFGGTVASLNEHFSHLQIIGLNIDPRQIERAKTKILPKTTNKIKFIVGNACDLPFADGTIDRVLAVECIFHFPDRVKFFKEVKRVLKPGGLLSISDFIPRRIFCYLTKSRYFKKNLKTGFGLVNMDYSLGDYEGLSQSLGFLERQRIDITKNSLPTYLFLRKLKSDLASEKKWTSEERGGRVGRVSEWVQLLTLVRYMVLTWEKPPPPL